MTLLKRKKAMIELGKLYKFSSDDNKVIYSYDPTRGYVPPEKRYVGELLNGDMFVPLQQTADYVFRILTTSGIIGWAYVRSDKVVDAKENE